MTGIRAAFRRPGPALEVVDAFVWQPIQWPPGLGEQVPDAPGPAAATELTLESSAMPRADRRCLRCGRPAGGRPASSITTLTCRPGNRVTTSAPTHGSDLQELSPLPMPSRIALATADSRLSGQIQNKSTRDSYWRLSEESGLLTSVRPTGCVHQEGVADEHITSGTRGKHLAISSMPGVGSSILGFRRHQAGPLHRLMQAVWPSPDESRKQSARFVIHAHVGEQTQQEQSSLLRSVVHEPSGVTCWLEA